MPPGYHHFLHKEIETCLAYQVQVTCQKHPANTIRVGVGRTTQSLHSWQRRSNYLTFSIIWRNQNHPTNQKICKSGNEETRQNGFVTHTKVGSQPFLVNVEQIFKWSPLDSPEIWLCHTPRSLTSFLNQNHPPDEENKNKGISRYITRGWFPCLLIVPTHYLAK